MMRAISLAVLLMASVVVASPQQIKYPVNLPVEVASFPGFTEGIVFDHGGNAFVSNGRKLWKVTPDGKASVWVSELGVARGYPFNGHKILGDDSHLVVDVGNQAIVHLDPNGNIIRKITECEDLPVLIPNDITLDPNGLGFYFTDSHTGIVCYVDNQWNTNWVTGGQSSGQRVHHYPTYTNPKTGKKYDTSRAKGYRQFNPNGIVIRPDGKTLLVAEADRFRILAYDVLAPGKVGPAKQFAFLPLPLPTDLDVGPLVPESHVGEAGRPDGMCLDADGNLYIAYHGTGWVVVIDKQGRLIRMLPSGARNLSNVAFWGPNMDQLYITGSVSMADRTGVLLRLDLSGLGIHGLKILPPATKSPWPE